MPRFNSSSDPPGNGGNVSRVSIHPFLEIDANLRVLLEAIAVGTCGRARSFCFMEPSFSAPCSASRTSHTVGILRGSAVIRAFVVF
jgi:hypothetical protein